MTTTWPQMGAALFVALTLHGGIAFWLALPAPERLPEPPPEQALRVSLLAVVAETTTAAAPVTPPPPQQVKPPARPKPKPKPAPKPVMQEPVFKPLPVKKTGPAPDLLPVEKPPEVVKTPVLIQNFSPAEHSLVPLDAVATAKYEQLLVAWLEKHKKYPRRAQRLRIEGEGLLRILIDRTGKTQQVTLEQRTGNRLLDKAVLEMAKNASPFPPMPENDPRQRLEFVVPVVFALR